MMRLGDDEMVAAVRGEFRDLLGVSAAPGFAEVRRWPESMPQYEVGHLARVAEIERAVAAIPAFAMRARRIAASEFPIACAAAKMRPMRPSRNSRHRNEH